MANTPLLFQSETTANILIAGIPSALRAFHRLCQAGVVGAEAEQDLIAAGGWQSTAGLLQEFNRQYPGTRIRFLALEDEALDQAVLAIDGLEAGVGTDMPEPGPICNVLARQSIYDAASARQKIASASRSIVASTGKPTDGLVSQWVNRPVSQFFSFHLLKLRWIRPIHATIAAGLIGVVMAVCFFLGGQTGLLIGAILFQFASIVDGVDGEIARATFRSSKLGATLDTATDALTNFAFIAGVSVNIWNGGNALAGQAGLAGLTLLFVGLSILGLLSLREGGPLSFDALKHDARETSKPIMLFVAKITSRDVYALVLAILILVGLAAPAMMVFAAAIGVWFIAAMIMLLRKPR
jgi:CDP-L-myo-inositol myo-inositolphosphotransferase